MKEFDAWMAGDATGAYRSSRADERVELLELESFRELQRLSRELHRARASASLDGATASQIDYLEQRITELTEFLSSAGWVL